MARGHEGGDQNTSGVTSRAEVPARSPWSGPASAGSLCVKSDL